MICVIQAWNILKSHKNSTYRKEARILLSMADIIKKLGYLKEAESHIDYIITTSKLHKYYSCVDMLSIATMLADIYTSYGKYQLSLNMCYEILQMREKIFSDSHPDIGYTCNAIGINLLRLKNYSIETYNYLNRAINIALLNIESSSSTSSSSSSSSSSQQHQQQHQQHQQHQQQFYSCNLAAAIGNYGLLLSYNDDNEKGLHYLLQSLYMEKKILLNEYHPNLAITYHDIALIYYQMQRYEDSKMFLYKALRTVCVSYSIHHPYYLLLEKTCIELGYSLPNTHTVPNDDNTTLNNDKKHNNNINNINILHTSETYCIFCEMNMDQRSDHMKLCKQHSEEFKSITNTQNNNTSILNPTDALVDSNSTSSVTTPILSNMKISQQNNTTVTSTTSNINISQSNTGMFRWLKDTCQYITNMGNHLQHCWNHTIIDPIMSMMIMETTNSNSSILLLSKEKLSKEIIEQDYYHGDEYSSFNETYNRSSSDIEFDKSMDKSNHGWYRLESDMDDGYDNTNNDSVGINNKIGLAMDELAMDELAMMS